MTVKPRAKILSITVNNEFIKICEITKNGKNIIVHKAIAIPTPERCYNDGIIRDRGVLGKILKVALDDNRITTTRAVFSISSTKIATKEVIIPNVKENKINEIVKLNASEYFPVNIDEYVIQYSVLEHLEGEENKIKILVMAAPTEMIEMYYDLASSLELAVDSIDYVGNSTYQALRVQIDDSPSIIIQIENDSTIVNIFNKNALQLQRTIPYGKSVVVNAAMDDGGLKYDPALKLLQEQELVHKEFDGDYITESLRYLISNVNRILDYYLTRNNKPIDKAYIIGNAATIKGLIELFAHELNMPIVNIDTIKDVYTDKKTYVEESSLPTYITNIGAFIAPVNFIPKNIVQMSQKRDDMKILKLALLVSIVVSAGLLAVSGVMTMTAKSQRDAMRVEVDMLKSVEGIVSDYYEAKDIASDAQAFKALTKGNNDVLSAFIYNLENKLPSDVSIKNMTSTNGAVTMSGVTSSKSSLALMIQNLSGMDNVTGVYVNSESEAKDDDKTVKVTFNLTCVFTNTDKD